MSHWSAFLFPQGGFSVGPRYFHFGIFPSSNRIAKETFICEVEVMKSEMMECELNIEGEFVSQDTMESWGWSEPPGLIVLAFDERKLSNFKNLTSG